MVAMVPFCASAEDRGTSAVPNSASNVRMLFRPTDYKANQTFYGSYLKNFDNGLEHSRSEWVHHEQEKMFNLSSWRNEYFALGSIHHAQVDDVKKAHANYVFSHRVREAGKLLWQDLKSRMKNREGYSLAQQWKSKTVQPTPQAPNRQTVESKATVIDPNTPVEQEEAPIVSEFNFAYDMWHDTTQLTYTLGRVSAGVYHPSLLGSLTSDTDILDSLSFGVSANLGETLPAAHVSYQYNSPVVTTSLSKSLSPTVSTQLTVTQPIRPEATDSYSMLLVYRF